MTLEELNTILNSTGYPVAYYQFNETPSFPCIVYKVNGKNNIVADDSVYKSFKNIGIELFCKNKDLEAEETLESVLNENNIIYSFTDVGRIEDESLYEVTYDIQI